MAEPSLRSCEIMQQLKHLPGYPDWEPVLLQNIAAHEDAIDAWAYIVHDSDVREDGTEKPPHIHLDMRLNQPLKTSTIAGYFGVPPQYVERIKQKKKVGNRLYADIGGALAYLTHRNAPEKHQYSDEQVVAKAGFDWVAVRTKSELSQAEFKSFQKTLEDIRSGKVRRYNLFDTITMEQYIEHKPDFERAFEYREGQLKNDYNRKLDVIFITGPSGSGKTTLAKQICEKSGCSYCLSGSNRDPMQDYAGQDALILDEVRPGVFTLSDLLKLLDNNSASSAGARYRDKWLETSLVIITTVLSIEDFFCGVRESGRESIVQLKRRCKIMILLTHAEMRMFTFKAATQEYMMFSAGANPIAEMYSDADTDTSEDDLRGMCDLLGTTYSPEGLPSDYTTN